MTTEERLWEVARKLADRTNEGMVVWEATASKNAFQAPFQKFTVRIVEVEGDGDPDYVLSIMDGNGKVIERISDVQLRDSIPGTTGMVTYRTMKDLYNTARRMALGVDDALDNILKALNESP